MPRISRQAVILVSAVALVAGGGGAAIATVTAQVRASWTDTVVQNAEQIPLPDGATKTLAAISLPKGKYVLTGAVSVYRGGGDIFGSCFISVGTKYVPNQAINYHVVSPTASDQVTMIGGVSVGSAGSVARLRCYNNGAKGRAMTASLIAHKTNSLGVFTQ